MIFNLLSNAIKTAKINYSKDLVRFCSINIKGATPSNFDKKLLVYFKRYSSVEEIPKLVPHDTLHKVRGKARMYFATAFMVVTLIGCYGMVKSGKHAAERGEFVQRQNIEWHKQMKQE